MVLFSSNDSRALTKRSTCSGVCRSNDPALLHTGSWHWCQRLPQTSPSHHHRLELQHPSPWAVYTLLWVFFPRATNLHVLQSNRYCPGKKVPHIAITTWFWYSNHVTRILNNSFSYFTATYSPDSEEALLQICKVNMSDKHRDFKITSSNPAPCKRERHFYGLALP